MQIKENVILADHTTFKIGGPARFFCAVSNEADLEEAVRYAKKKRQRIFVLGGGSNVLISDKGFPGLVIKIELKGVSYRPEGQKTIVSAAAGEMWDELVAATVDRGLYGLENLSAIPGTVGAAPVQNIGAYGAEVSETIRTVRAFDRKALAYVELSNTDCQFSYRESIFKYDRRRYIITRVDFDLAIDGQVNLKYKDVSEYFKRKAGAGGVSGATAGFVAGAEPSLREVRDAVIDIRWNKLPDWKKWGTAGSFFKNPIITERKWKQVKKLYPGIPSFPEPDNKVKVSLGWILDNICDVKGLCLDGACVYEKQALVIVTKPGATSYEVVKLAQEIMKRVKKKTGISITGEVEWVN